MRKKIREDLIKQKNLEAAEIKKEKKRNELRLKEQNQGMMIENQRVSTRIKAGIFQAKLKIKDFSNSRIQEFKKQKMSKIKEEELEVKKKELEMAKMELMEMEMIKKLQNTHDVQKNLYQEYDSLLNESIEEFEKKFKPPENKKYVSVDSKGPIMRKSLNKNPHKDKMSPKIRTPQALHLTKAKNTSSVNISKGNDNEKKEGESPIKENYNGSP